jgi:hypothetical protein
MGWHFCTHYYWHRALILFGTVAYFYGVGMAVLCHRWPSDEWWLWMTMAWLVSTWLFNHLLQWRCQGPEPRAHEDGRRLAGLALVLASLALLTRDGD